MPDAKMDILNDSRRLDKIRALNLMQEAPDPAFDRLTRLAAKLLKTPIAYITLVDADRQFFVSHVGLPEPYATRRETPLSHSICQHVVALRQPLIIPDIRIDPLLKDNPAITTFGVVAYAGIPLITSDRLALGTLCIIDHQPRQWSTDEIETLTDLAHSVVTEIELRAEIIQNVETAAELSAAEMTLTHERNLLRTVLDSVPIGIFMKGTTGRYMFVNSAFAEYVNLTREQLIGTDVRGLYGGYGPSYFQEDMDILASGEGRIAIEESHPDPRDPDQLRWYLTSKIPLRDSRDQLYGLLGVITDITERKGFEASLIKTQAQFQAAVMNAPMIYYSIDANGIFTQVEGRGLAQLGLNPNQLVGTSVFELFPDDPSVSERVHRVLDGEAFSDLVRLGDFHFSITYSPIVDSAGWVTGAIAVALDVTERMEAEADLEENVERLKTLRRIEAELNATLEVDQVLMFGLDVAARVSGAEHGFIALVEGDTVRLAKPLGQYSGVSAYALGHGIVQRVYQSKQAVWLRDVKQDPDYEPDIPSTVSLMMLPLVRHGRVIGIMDLETSHREFFEAATFEFLKLVAARLAVALENAQLYEVTSRQLTELQELYGRVSYLERLKTDMIRIAAHDLRNPLTAIMGMTELLLEDKASLTEDQLEFIGDIDRASRQMYKMTADILSIQRIEQSAAAWQPLDLAAMVQSLCENAQQRASRKHQTFELRVPQEALVVKGDEVQLREAIDNLIGNAIKYTPEGGKISVCLMRADDHLVRFEVEDTGYGIPENQQARLFQPFYRAKTAETRQIEGTGLGLHLVKNIIERHFGQLHLHSVYGKGSTFGFTLKLHRDSPSTPPTFPA